MTLRSLAFSAAALVFCAPLAAQTPLGTAFTFQGSLSQSGAPVNGTYDLRFRLYDAAAGGGQVGPVQCLDNAAVTAGAVNAVLDFGAAFAGDRRWLEIDVRADTGTGCGDATGWTTLSPRQELLASPNAVYTLRAGDSSGLSGQPASFYRDASNLSGGVLADGRLSSNVALLNRPSQAFAGVTTMLNPANSFAGAFQGNGSLLTALNASNLSAGTVADARLSANVALLDRANTFTAPNTFGGAVFRVNSNGASTPDLDQWHNPAGNLAQIFTSTVTQTLTCGVGGQLTQVDVLISGNMDGVPGEAMRIEIRNSGGALLGSSDIGTNLESLGVFWAPVTVSPPVAVGVGTVIRIHCVPTQDPAVYVSSGDQYGGGTCSLGADRDLAFRTWVQASGAAGSFYVSPTTGRVGVGTTNPLGQLGVSSNISVGDARGRVSIESATGGGVIRSLTSAQTQGQTVLSVVAQRVQLEDPYGRRYLSTTSSGLQVGAGSVVEFADSAGTPRGAVGLVGLPGSVLIQSYSGAIGLVGSGVGIGTTSPAAKLHVDQPSPGGDGIGTIFGPGWNNNTPYNTGNQRIAIFAWNGNPGVSLTRHGQLGFLTEVDTGGYAVKEGYQGEVGTRLRIATGGNVGLGIDSPAARLDVVGLGAAPAMLVRSPGDAQGRRSVIGLYSTFEGTADNGARRSADIVSGFSGQSWGGEFLAFHVGNNGQPNDSQLQTAEKVRVTGGGRVGIGTAAPITRLTVAQGSIHVEGTSQDLSTDPGEAMQFGHYDGTTFTQRMSIAASGAVNVVGTLSKGGGSFRIDHPLDPLNKELWHSFVESPDMMNIYNGNITTDAGGYATVVLPGWFEALNRDFRYQLTILDESDADDVILWAKVVRKVEGGSFTIRTNLPGVEVSWQVTGIRKDAFAEKNRIPVEVEKPAEERGKYIHPEAFGAPAAQGVHVRTTQGP